MDRSAQHATPHDLQSCALCGTLRHPATAAQGRALAAPLAKHPMPRQAGAR